MRRSVTYASTLCSSQAPHEVTGTTEGFNANYFFSADSCPGENFGMGEASNDVAYRFTAPQTATYTFRLNADYDSLLYVVGDCFEVNETRGDVG